MQAPASESAQRELGCGAFTQHPLFEAWKAASRCVTPYVGLGWGFSPSNTPGFGFYADLGVLIGRFKTEVTTTLVGKQGITQADIDAETADLRDSTAKLSVLPKFSVGVSYRF